MDLAPVLRQSSARLRREALYWHYPHYSNQGGKPGGQGGSSGGQREFAPVMARAAVALGVAGVFIETHEAPDTAPSDGPNMIPLDRMPALIGSLMSFDRLAKADPVMG